MTRIQNLKSLMNELKPAMMAFFILGITTIYLSLKYYSPSFIEGIFVEAHGMLMDIFVFAVLFAISNKLLEKRKKIRGYLEEIEDFRSWSSEEAGFRIVGLIKRLYSLGHKEISLSGCHLENKNLTFLDGHATSFNGHFNGSNFSHLDLSGKALDWSSFENSHFFNTNLSSATFYVS